MKIPLIWLQDYVDTGKKPKEIADSFTRIGLMLDKPVGEDKVLDLEQRLNRSDLLSILGCARDLSVFENIKLNEPKVKIHKSLTPTVDSKIDIRVDTPAVRRFNTRVFRGVKVGPSPKWLKERLELYGIDSINNIVDITNFVMVEMGQPMHAQDIDKLPAREINIRQARKGERIVTLLGTEITLDETAFILTSGGKPLVIGGIVGGAFSGVTGETANIILDAGNYDPRAVRKASRKFKIMNETVLRYDKPLDPRLTELALNRATDLILELAGGTYYDNFDYYPEEAVPQTLTLSLKRLDLISGLDIKFAEAKKILVKLGYSVIEENPESLTVEVPYFRTDVEVEDDLVSDILRMRDYNNIPAASLDTPIPPDITPPIYRFEEKLRDLMVALGAHEHITTQLVQNDGRNDRVSLENALSDDQNALRISALETLAGVFQVYQKHGANIPVLFEIGKSFDMPGYREIRELAVIDKTDVRSTLATVLDSLGLSQYLLVEKDGSVEIFYQDKVIGKLFSDSFILYPDQLLPLAKSYAPLTSDFYHRTILDLSLSLPEEMRFTEVIQIIRREQSEVSLVEVVEEYEEWKLVRLTWNKQVKDIDKVRLQLTKALKSLGVTTRSE